MLHKLFRWRQCFVEVVGVNNERRIFSHEEYISKIIADRRAEAELFRMGISLPRNPDYRFEYVMRRLLS